jgi:mRNA interferase RelE/StbE
MLGGAERAAVLRYLHERIEGDEDPKRFGKALVGPLAGLWRYRVGDARIIVRVEADVLVVLVVKIENRGTVYR